MIHFVWFKMCKPPPGSKIAKPWPPLLFQLGLLFHQAHAEAAALLCPAVFFHDVIFPLVKEWFVMVSNG